MSHEKHYFYGYNIFRDRQQAFIQSLLLPYKDRQVTDALKKEIWDLLQQEKNKGTITIPFKMALRRDPAGIFPDYVEVILDTKV